MSSLKAWVDDLRALHAKAKANKISAEERELYEAGRHQLARAMLSSQQLTLKPGETARRMLRVARALQLDLQLDAGTLRTPTVDLSAGGFAALLPSAGVPTERVRYALRLPAGDPVTGFARPVQTTVKSGHTRVSFTFEEISDEDRERVELVVFDAALALFTL